MKLKNREHILPGAKIPLPFLALLHSLGVVLLCTLYVVSHVTRLRTDIHIYIYLHTFTATNACTHILSYNHLQEIEFKKLIQ
jgi:hypothetical protein